jgi:DNA-binding transcriptional MerR regulator
MQSWTVKQLASLSGVSIRTLHHYDQIGLLKPAWVGENNYRHYGREELLRLQQILIHRELDIPLRRIAAILDDPEFDRRRALAEQRALLAEKAERYAELVRTIDRTIAQIESAQIEGERTMNEADLYKGFSAEKQAEYEQWLIDRYGAGMKENIARSRKAIADWTPADHETAMAELAEVEQALAEGLRRGAPPQSDALAPLLERHRAWVGRMWDRPCPPDAYAGLADLYLSHPDFIKRYETIEPGFAEYLTTAMKHWVAMQRE